MKKIISLILVFAMIATGTLVALSANPQLPLADKEAEYVHDTSANHSAVQITSTQLVAQYLKIDKPFKSIQAKCPSYSDSVGNLTMRLYNWAGDYNSTVKGQIVMEQEWVDFGDNAWVGIVTPEGTALPAGEYLWILADPVQTVGIWKGDFDNLDTNIIQESYVSGQLVEGCHECRVFYADEGATVTGGTTPSGPETPAKVIPKDSENIIMFVNSNTSYVKGTETTLDVAPTVINGRTFLPARFVSEKLGATVTWLEESQTVVIEQGDLVIALVVGESAIRVSGIYQPIDAATYVTEGRTMVPIRAITEALGQQINYFDPGLIVIGPNAESFAETMANAFVELY